MSEKSPQETSYVQPEIVTAEELPPRDEAIDAVRGEINNLREEIQTAEEKAGTPGFKATANDLVASKMALRDIRAANSPRLSALEEMWSAYGGDDIDQAQAAVEGLNFKSDASDHVAAKMRLRDAKDAFYGKLQESKAEEQSASTNVPELNAAHDEPEDGEDESRVAANRLAELKATEPKGSELDADEASRLEALRAAKPAASELDDKADAEKLAELRNTEPKGSELEGETKVSDAERLDVLRNTEPDPSQLLDGLEGAAKEMPWYERAYYRAGMLYQRGLNKILGFNRESGEGKEKRTGTKRMRNIAFGAIALVGAGFAVKYAHDSGLLGGGGHHHADPTLLPNGSTPAEASPHHPGVVPSVVRHDAFSEAAQTVRPGEGWYQTMSEAGITDPATRAEILHNDVVMQRLANMHLGYKAPELGGWGISMPADGKMPQAALDILADAAK